MARKLAVEIIGDSSSLERAFRRSSRSAQGFNRDIESTGKHTSVFSGLGKAASLAAGAAGIGGFGEAVKASFEEMSSAAKVGAQTNAVIKSTGEAANVSAGHVDELATSLLNKSGVDDEVIKSGENVLLTFTGIRNEAGKNNNVFDQATRATLDLSTAMHEDMSTAAVQVGKALNDPIKGLTALRRVGVTFTTQQKAQVTQMVKTGNTMGAQKVILHELNREFGGSAAAAGKTLPGQLNILKQTMLNLGGSIATMLLPQIQSTVREIVHWISQSKNQKTILDIVKGAIGAVRVAVRFLGGAFRVLSALVGGNSRAVKVLIAAYAGFKILKIASNLITLAGALTSTAVAEGEAAAGAEGLSIALGPAVLVAGALAAGAALGTLLMQIKPVHEAMVGLATDIASLFGYKNPMAQFAGKKIVPQNQVTAIRRQAGALERQGLSPAQAAGRLAQQYPSYARRDLGVFAGEYSHQMVIHNLNLVGVQNPAQLSERLQKHARQRPHRRR